MISKNRFKIHTSSNYGVYIESLPYKSSKYTLKLILYLIALGLFILGIIYRDILFSEGKPYNIFQFLRFLFFGSLMTMFSICGLPLLFSVIKNTFYRNFFLKEHLSIEKEKIEYSNSFGKKINYKISQIKSIYFEFNKPFSDWSGVPELVPNYTPTIFFRDQNDKIIGKIMYSVKEEEIQNVYKIILDYLLSEKHFYRERNVDYKDAIKDFRHWGKEIEFISVGEFLEIHDRKFSNEERDYYYNLSKQQTNSKDELSNALISKIKDDDFNKM
jgi:hypothetical protein